MKNILLGIALVTGILSYGQTSPGEVQAKEVVTTFFDAFHRQDSVALRSLAHPNLTMQSIGANSEGKNKLSTSSYSDFLKSIVSIPSETSFEEKLHSFDVKVNGPLATVITPYSFFLNGQLSHCGVNSFTMFKEAEEWKIIYIVDTRSKDGCEE